MKKELVVELRGVEFVNKGAELMLYAIISKIKEWDFDVKFVMEKNKRSPMAKHKELGIYTKAKFKKYKIDYSPLFTFFSSNFLRKYNLIKEADINVVLDGSGFAFGDQWGAKYAYYRLGEKVGKWHRQGKKIILMPQAFGPFSDEALKTVMRTIVENSDLVFARESQSLAYLQEISNAKKIFKAPDFTNLLNGIIPSDFNSSVNEVAIVPNYKMVEQSTDLSTYTDFLLKAIELVKSNGKNPYFLIHEGKRDRDIAEQVNSKLSVPLNIIFYPNVLEIKGVISTAHYIICSRFHGVVSALSQGIPCIATSWSHKYEMLLSEYDFKEFLLKDLEDYSLLEKMISDLSKDIVNLQLSDKLKNNAAIQKEGSNEMWSKVYELLNN